VLRVPKESARQTRHLLWRPWLPCGQALVVLSPWQSAVPRLTTRHGQLDCSAGNELGRHFLQKRLGLQAKLGSSEGVDRKIDHQAAIEDCDEVPVPEIVRCVCRSLTLHSQEDFYPWVGVCRHLDEDRQGSRPHSSVAAYVNGYAREQDAVVGLTPRRAHERRALGNEQFGRDASRISGSHGQRLASH
jgi:hypothetical protein